MSVEEWWLVARVWRCLRKMVGGRRRMARERRLMAGWRENHDKRPFIDSAAVGRL
jgi:hypothetical protein